MILTLEKCPEIDFLDYKKKIWDVSKQRFVQKEIFSSTRVMGRDFRLSHTSGLAGEVILAIYFGHPEFVNWDLNIIGDCGEDFNQIDVKAATFFTDPDLKEDFLTSPLWQRKFKNGKLPAKYYVLVSVDLKKSRGWVIGWCKAVEIFTKSSIKNYTYGDRHCLNWRSPFIRSIETFPIEFAPVCSHIDRYS